MTGGNIGEEPLQAGSLERPAGDAAVIISVADRLPAFAGLTLDIGGAGLVLGIEAVEVLLQPFLARLAGVDGAALVHAARFRGFVPKKAGPDHCVPVIVRAISDRLFQSRSFQR